MKLERNIILYLSGRRHKAKQEVSALIIEKCELHDFSSLLILLKQKPMFNLNSSTHVILVLFQFGLVSHQKEFASKLVSRPPLFGSPSPDVESSHSAVITWDETICTKWKNKVRFVWHVLKPSGVNVIFSPDTEDPLRCMFLDVSLLKLDLQGKIPQLLTSAIVEMSSCTTLKLSALTVAVPSVFCFSHVIVDCMKKG